MYGKKINKKAFFYWQIDIFMICFYLYNFVYFYNKKIIDRYYAEKR